MRYSTGLVLLAASIAVLTPADRAAAENSAAPQDISEKIESPVKAPVQTKPKPAAAKVKKAKKPDAQAAMQNRKYERFVVNPDGTITINAVPGQQEETPQPAKKSYSIEEAIQATPAPAPVAAQEQPQPAPEPEPAPVRKAAQKEIKKELTKEKRAAYTTVAPGSKDPTWWEKGAVTKVPGGFAPLRDLKAPPSAPEFLPSAASQQPPAPPPVKEASIAETPTEPVPPPAAPEEVKKAEPKKEEPKKEEVKKEEIKTEPVKEAAGPVPSDPVAADPTKLGRFDRARAWLDQLKQPLEVEVKTPDKGHTNE